MSNCKHEQAFHFSNKWRMLLGTNGPGESIFVHIWYGTDEPDPVECKPKIELTPLQQRVAEWLAAGLLPVALAEVAGALLLHEWRGQCPELRAWMDAKEKGDGDSACPVHGEEK